MSYFKTIMVYQNYNIGLMNLPVLLAEEDEHSDSSSCRHSPQQQRHLRRRRSGSHDLVYKSKSKRHGKDPHARPESVPPRRICGICLRSLQQLEADEEADDVEACESNHRDGSDVSPGLVDRHAAVVG